VSTIDVMIAAVITDTGRADKSDLIGRYVRAAVVKCHEIDFFAQDKVSAQITIATPGTSITHALPTGWRKFQSVIPCTSAGLPLGKRFELDESGFVDSLDAEDKKFYKDYYKVIGANLVAQSECTISYIKWTYWASPTVTSGSTETWLCAKYPQAIIDLATGYVQNKLGNAEIGQFNLDLFNRVWLPEIRQNLREEL
jgi:hypothetical protein